MTCETYDISIRIWNLKCKYKDRVWANDIFYFKMKFDTSLDIKCLKLANEIIKLISFLILMILFVISSVGILSQYFERTTLMKTNVVSQNNALFPAITFCPVTAGYKNEIFRVST